MINTVRGAITKEELGKTLSHEHLVLDLRKVRKDNFSFIDDVDEVVDELSIIKKYNINSIVELTTNDMGRNVKKLYEISKETGLNIICSTGFYLDSYHSDEFRKKTIDEIADIMIGDIEVGIDGTDIKAGAIGEIASKKNSISESELKVFKAACIASNKTGTPIFTHCQLGKFGDEQIKIFKEGKVDLDKIVLGHIDLNSDINFIISLLKENVNIAFDTIGKSEYMSDEIRKDNLIRLIDEGFENNILISQDVSRRSYFKINGGNGYEPAPKFIQELMDLNKIDPLVAQKLLEKNPSRILNIN